MATSKAKARTSKKRTRKASTKKASTKTAAKKVTRKSAIDENAKIKGFPGGDEHFYKKFPRYHAYQLLLAARNRTMKVSTFLDKVEELDGVKNRAQARGIVQKLVDKKRHCGMNFATLQK